MECIKNIIYDIVLSVLVLSLLAISVIPLFRRNMNIISLAAEKANEIEKISSESVILNKQIHVTGSDVISVVRYYSTNENVEIHVTVNQGGTKVYISETYDSEDFNIPYESMFSANYIYDGDVLVHAEYIE